MPTIWDRSRKEAINYLKEWIKEKIQIWRNRLLNNVGKEILIKSVVTVMPSYVMNIVKFPSTWFVEIDAMTTRFWWGASNGDKNIHWKKWEAMTKAKKEGSYGFKELQTFNSAMLSNMETEILTAPNALWVRVMESLSFPNTDFM